MVSSCFKITLYAGFALAFVNFVTNIVALCVWDSEVSDYQSYGESITSYLESVEANNFHANSTWFTALSDEYENLSDLDKANVYCDVLTIQADPAEHHGEGLGIWLLACIFSATSILAFIMLSCALYCMAQHGSFYTVEYDLEMGDNNKGQLQQSREDRLRENPPPQVNKTKENAWAFKSMTAFLFCETSPLIALIWLMITRTGQSTGLACQEMFFACGVSGDCGMGDLMAPVALDSSVLNTATLDPLYATAFFSGVVTLVFAFLSGLCLFFRSCNLTFILLPVFQLLFAALPFSWVYYLNEEVVDIGALEGILILANVPLLVMLGAIVVNCCRSRKKL